MYVVRNERLCEFLKFKGLQGNISNQDFSGI